MCGGDIEEREGRGVAESPVRVHTVAHKVTPYTLCMVAKLATYMEWPVATHA